MDEKRPKHQIAGQRAPVKRTRHVWTMLEKGRWKCVICGGISHQPSNDCTPIKYESLTVAEREMCPPTYGKDGVAESTDVGD